MTWTYASKPLLSSKLALSPPRYGAGQLSMLFLGGLSFWKSVFKVKTNVGLEPTTYGLLGSVTNHWTTGCLLCLIWSSFWLEEQQTMVQKEKKKEKKQKKENICIDCCAAAGLDVWLFINHKGQSSDNMWFGSHLISRSWWLTGLRAYLKCRRSQVWFLVLTICSLNF